MIWFYALSVAIALVDCLHALSFVVEELIVGVGEVDSCSLDALGEGDGVEAAGLLVAVDKRAKETFVDCGFVVVDNFRAILVHRHLIYYEL